MEDEELLEEYEMTDYEKAFMVMYYINEDDSVKMKKNIIDKALKICPDYFMAYVELASITKDHYKEIELLRKAVEIARRISTKSFDDITKYVEVMIFSQYVEALKALGEAYCEHGRFEEAIEIFEEAINVGPHDPLNIRYRLINLYCLENKDELASNLIEMFAFDDSTMMVFNKALVSFRMQRYDEAMHYLEEGQKRNRFVVGFLLDMSKIKINDIAPSFRPKTRKEAAAYCIQSFRSWYKTKGIMDTLLTMTNKRNVDSSFSN